MILLISGLLPNWAIGSSYRANETPQLLTLSQADPRPVPGRLRWEHGGQSFEPLWAPDKLACLWHSLIINVTPHMRTFSKS